MAILKPFVRSPYNYDMNVAGDESGLKCEDPSLAVQDQRDEVDINTIVRRFGLTGRLPEDVRAPSYGDFVGISDYHEAMNAVSQANEAFDELPAEVRARFENDPGQFVDFCSDARNIEQLKDWKLLLPAKMQAMEDSKAREAKRIKDLEDEARLRAVVPKP